VSIPAAPTQVRRPWRTLVRSVFQAVVGFAAIVPLLVEAAGIDDTLPLVAAGITVSAAITRIMALPGVEAWLREFVPFLAANPPAPITALEAQADADAAGNDRTGFPYA
jgi:hypothetical protein